jgi:hypothetical protein
MRLASDGPPNACANCSNSSAPTEPVLIPRSQPSSQCRPRYVIGPDDSVAYADINVDYRSEPELFAVLLVLQRLQNATS